MGNKTWICVLCLIVIACFTLACIEISKKEIMPCLQKTPSKIMRAPELWQHYIHIDENEDIKEHKPWKDDDFD